MNRIHLLTLVALLGLFAAACATPATGTGTSTRTTQGALETIGFQTTLLEAGAARLTLENGSSRAIGANLCTARLEVQANGTWAPVEDRLPSDCVDEHAVLNPGAERDATFQVGELAEGTYRFAMPIEIPMGLGFEEIASSPFSILGTSEQIEERIEGIEQDDANEAPTSNTDEQGGDE
jgi:hypothetical protein